MFVVAAISEQAISEVGEEKKDEDGEQKADEVSVLFIYNHHSIPIRF